MRNLLFLILPAFLLTPTAHAQGVPIIAEGKGGVTGHVICSDTGRPARFAQAILLAVPKTVTKPMDPALAAKNPAAAMVKGLNMLGEVNMVSSESDFDGAFTASSVAPGDYYVFASVPGYIQPTNLIASIMRGSTDYSRPLPGVPIVHVSADRMANVDVSAIRGASVTGTIAWDDGSPVTRATVQVLPAAGPDQQLPPQFSMLTMFSMIGGGLGLISDDTGRYHVSGLAPGEYIFKASFQTGAQMGIGASGTSFAAMGAIAPLIVYAPSSLHQSGAKAVSLVTGQDTRDINITFNLAGTHSLSGHVLALADRHPINSGKVTLHDATDKTFLRSAGVDSQGAFEIQFVPPGSYTATVQDAEDTKPGEKKGRSSFGAQPETVRSYEDSSPRTLTVLDQNLTGVEFTLTVEDPAAQKKRDAEIENLIKQ